MAGIYTAQMVAMRFGVSDHRARQALMACGVGIDLNDQVDADVLEKNSDKLKKWLDEDWKAYQASKQEAAGAGDAKAAWLAEHNAKVEAELAAAGGWNALVTKSASAEE